MNKIKNIFKKIFNKKEYIWQDFHAVSQKDKSGRYRYYIYIDGKLAKTNFSFRKWLKIEKKDKIC